MYGGWEFYSRARLGETQLAVLFPLCRMWVDLRKPWSVYYALWDTIGLKLKKCRSVILRNIGILMVYSLSEYRMSLFLSFIRFCVFL